MLLKQNSKITLKVSVLQHKLVDDKILTPPIRVTSPEYVITILPLTTLNFIQNNSVPRKQV